MSTIIAKGSGTKSRSVMFVSAPAKLSPSSKRMFELLQRRAQEALDRNEIDYDREACHRDIDELQFMHSYMTRRNEDAAELDKFRFLAQMGDYATVFSQALKDVEGTSFKNMDWNHIVGKLDEER